MPSQFSKHKWWVVTGLMMCPLLALAQAVPNVFTPGTKISAAEVNANFAALTMRLAALEAAVLKNPAIPNITDAVNASYTAAAGANLAVYTVVPGEAAANQAGASCKTGDTLIGGGCVAVDGGGGELCMVERSYPIDASTWFCRSRRATGAHTQCRTSPMAVCLTGQPR